MYPDAEHPCLDFSLLLPAYHGINPPVRYVLGNVYRNLTIVGLGGRADHQNYIFFA